MPAVTVWETHSQNHQSCRSSPLLCGDAPPHPFASSAPPPLPLPRHLASRFFVFPCFLCFFAPCLICITCLRCYHTSYSILASPLPSLPSPLTFAHANLASHAICPYLPCRPFPPPSVSSRAYFAYSPTPCPCLSRLPSPPIPYLSPVAPSPLPGEGGVSEVIVSRCLVNGLMGNRW